MELVLKAYAKINLSIDITGRLANGYHELDTVMQSISLCDTLTVKTLQNDASVNLRVENSNIEFDENNTVLLAEKYFFEAYNKPRDFGLDITLHKEIPSAAGLGGGSADAAAMLIALNTLKGNPFSIEELLAISKKVGADVPFCLIGGTKRVQGIGDVIIPMQKLMPCAFVLIKNAQKPSTAEMYKKIDNAENPVCIDVDKTCKAIETGDIKMLSQNCKNIFLAVWESKEISSAMRELTDNGAITSALSGSGPTVYGLFRDTSSAEEAYTALCEKYDNIFSAVPVNCGVEIVSVK